VADHFFLEEGLCDVPGDALQLWREDREMQRERFVASDGVADFQNPGALADAPDEAPPRDEARRGESPAAAGGELPTSPAAFLRLVQSDAFQRQQAEEWGRVHGSYEVHDGCPFLPSRPLYTIATPAAGSSEHGLAFSLRTRRPLAAEEQELADLVGLSRGEDGEARIRVSRLVDGVVAFEDPDAAGAFLGLVEREEGEEGAQLMEVDAFELFRMTHGVGAVVVLLRDLGGDFVPRPYQLALSVRGERPEEG